LDCHRARCRILEVGEQGSAPHSLDYDGHLVVIRSRKEELEPLTAPAGELEKFGEDWDSRRAAAVGHEVTAHRVARRRGAGERAATAEPPARAAQQFEVSPFIGYRVGGSFKSIDAGQHVELDDHGSFALALDTRADESTQYELFYGRQSTVLRGDALAPSVLTSNICTLAAQWRSMRRSA